MKDDDLEEVFTADLRRMSQDRHQIFKKLEAIKQRMDKIQLQMLANKNVPADILEVEMQSLEEEGYRLEIQLTEIMAQLKNVRETCQSPEAM